MSSRLAGMLLAGMLLATAPPPARAEQGPTYTPHPTPVAEGVYAIVGPTGGRTRENHGLNNNLGFVVTEEGVVLIDSGASAASAALVEAAVGEVTDRPVRWVVNTGSQDHRWLGNGYFRDRGARLIALKRTKATQRRYADQHLAGLKPVLGDALAGTVPAYADPPLAGDRAELELGGVRLVLWWPGDAHFPGDAVVWLPERQVLFTGDLVYVDRMLGILPWSDVSAWQEAFHRAAALEPEVVVPGHGQVCGLDKARRETGDYLDFLVEAVGTAVADWEPLDAVVERLADAPAFAHLRHYDSWHRTNVNRTYLQLEGH
jgi:glyoxylase-like metal-dependent hydrolase (beta-lactamase superfamily II)